MQRNLSEQLFEKFCATNGIRVRRFEEETLQTPDYELLLPETTIITEVKEIERNALELESDRLLHERGFGLVTGGTPGERVRAKISAASPQIKAKTNGKLPGMLVLFDRGLSAGHVDPYNIRVAMYGLEQIHIALPPVQSGQSPLSTGMSYGPRYKMSPNSNTSISAVAALVTPGPERVDLVAYHNLYAVNPLPRGLLAKYGVDEYELEEKGIGRTSKWQRINP